jgi:hypothetical protein
MFRGICDQQQEQAKQPGRPVPVCDFENVLLSWEIALFLYPAGMLVATIRRRNPWVSNVGKPFFVAQAVNLWVKGFGTLLR